MHTLSAPGVSDGPQAAHPQLGRHLRSFAPAEASAPNAAVALLVILGLGWLPGLGLSALALGLLIGGNVPGALLVAAGAAVFLGFGRWLQQSRRQARDDRRDLYEGGVVARRGGKLTVLAWDDVTAVLDNRVVYQQLVGKDQRARFLTLRGQRGQEALFFDDEADEAHALATQHCFPRLLAQARVAIARGQPVGFGRITLERPGLTLREPGKRPTLRRPWAQIDHFLYREGALLMICKDGQTEQLELLRAIPNLPVFERVLSEDFKMLLDLTGTGAS